MKDKILDTLEYIGGRIEDFTSKLGRWLLETIDYFLSLALKNIGSKNHDLTASFDAPRKLLTKRGRGFALGDRFMDLKKSEENLVVIASTGSGKSQSVVIPSIIHASISGHSQVITDGGDLAMLVPLLKYYNDQVLYLELDNLQPSVFYNPLARLSLSNKSGINKVAFMLQNSGQGGSDTKGGDMYFSQKSQELIALVITLLLELGILKYINIANVFWICENMMAYPKKIDKLFANTSEVTWVKYKALDGTSENTKSSIVSSATASLSHIGNDPTLCTITSKDNIDFSSFRTQQTALLLKAPIGSTYHNTIISLFMEQFYDFFLSKMPRSNDRHIALILDELASIIPAIQGFSKYLSVSRKFKILTLGVLQSESQLSQLSEAKRKSIMTNFSNKAYMGNLFDEAAQLSSILGKYSYRDKKNPNQEKQRDLMSEFELRTMAPNTAIILSTGGIKPIKTKLLPAYKSPRLQKLMNADYPIDTDSIKHHEVSYLPLDLGSFDEIREHANNLEEEII